MLFMCTPLFRKEGAYRTAHGRSRCPRVCSKVREKLPMSQNAILNDCNTTRLTSEIGIASSGQDQYLFQSPGIPAVSYSACVAFQNTFGPYGLSGFYATPKNKDSQTMAVDFSGLLYQVRLPRHSWKLTTRAVMSCVSSRKADKTDLLSTVRTSLKWDVRTFMFCLGVKSTRTLVIFESFQNIEAASWCPKVQRWFLISGVRFNNQLAHVSAGFCRRETSIEIVCLRFRLLEFSGLSYMLSTNVMIHAAHVV
jgi:hypothetical protein